MRKALIIVGALLLFCQQYIVQVNTTTQFIVFLIGIIFLGVPHGAADLLVANRTATSNQQKFSTIKFLVIYISRLFLFAATLWFLPVVGNLLFILFAAYHFGETDLYSFKTNTLLGKLFVISYGLVILSVILLHHFEEVKPLYQMFEAGKKNIAFINWIDLHRYYILSFNGILFFACTFIYFLKNNTTDGNVQGEFLLNFALILIILFNLPMLLGFTFYFVVWHSVLSLKNIVTYLRFNQSLSDNIIVKQIVLYSLISIVGIGLFGLTGFMYISTNAIAGYIFLGLAVLTAPHMQIMHDMYNSIRLKK